MDDWDAEDFEPLPPVLGKLPPVLGKDVPKNQWDDEDAEEEVKPNRVDEEQPTAVSAAKPKPEKKTEKKKEKPKKEVSKNEPLSDPLAEKLRQQRLVEEADYKHTTALFSGQQSKEEKSLEDFIPKSEDDFLTYAELLSDKIRPYEKSFHYITLLKAVMRYSVATLTAADVKELASSLTVIANEKLKAEKDTAAGKKKTGPKKKQLLVDKPDDDGFAPGAYDTVDDYDFM